MELLFSITLGVLIASGVFLVLQKSLFSIVLGLTLISYGVNLFLLSMGRLYGDPAIINTSIDYTDPLPQALVLTAIVISFGMTAFTVTLALKYSSESKSNLDEQEKREN